MIAVWIIVVLCGSFADVQSSSDNPFDPTHYLNRGFWVFDNCFYTNAKCPNENITFWLYSRESRTEPKSLNVENLQSSDFTPKRPLTILIHGYTGNRDASPNTQIRDPLLDADDIYVLSVDYSPLAPAPCYPFAVENAKYIGKCIAQIVDNLVAPGFVDMDDIHVIGFSLGAQVAGIIANHLKTGKLKWITGLDPAKPIFNFFNNDGRLDSSDAEFVDVIHTDVLERGMLAVSGHVDFYPNGGTNQPGCKEQTEASVGQCNHDRAPEFYAESLTSSTKQFWGYACYSWFNFMLGLCKWSPTSEVEIMGYRVPKNASGVFFLETNPNPPFALGPYPNSASSKDTSPPSGQIITENPSPLNELK
ncbi:unnamed protein product [Hermetia illucens]|uniref:Lipase domain-containing protein n=1 Tax=Hermetia illucens TaxID=343691 RepID=A0A7R8UGI5_HERIL|nr:pancreatic lipase-related protein 2-like [Hermetia illucens]CAD7080179.1 unnamed protein product [Hermetia illucens]